MFLGAYSPAPVMTAEMERRTLDEIVRPCIAEMARRGIPYKGVLYAGLMIDESGPRLIEYNVRFGDPECQVLMLRLGSDFLPALIACAEGGLDKVALDWNPEPAIAVVMAAEGYPGSYEKGTEIKGLDQARKAPGVTVFHAGTKANGDRILANGGRVLNARIPPGRLQRQRHRRHRGRDLHPQLAVRRWRNTWLCRRHQHKRRWGSEYFGRDAPSQLSVPGGESTARAVPRVRTGRAAGRRSSRVRDVAEEL